MAKDITIRKKKDRTGQLPEDAVMYYTPSKNGGEEIRIENAQRQVVYTNNNLPGGSPSSKKSIVLLGTANTIRVNEVLTVGIKNLRVSSIDSIVEESGSLFVQQIPLETNSNGIVEVAEIYSVAEDSISFDGDTNEFIINGWTYEIVTVRPLR